jgi:hypothetical protein
MSLARALTYALAAASWLLVDFVTWRTHGMLASSSLVDVVRLARAHEAQVSSVDIAAIAALPILGAALGALCAWGSPVVALIRIALALVGVGTALALLLGLGAGQNAAFGPGAWLAVAGVVAAIVGVVIDGISVALRCLPLESAS